MPRLRDLLSTDYTDENGWNGSRCATGAFIREYPCNPWSINRSFAVCAHPRLTASSRTPTPTCGAARLRALGCSRGAFVGRARRSLRAAHNRAGLQEQSCLPRNSAGVVLVALAFRQEMPTVAPAWKKAALWVAAAACALPWVSPPFALLAGLAFALFVGNTDLRRTAIVQKYLLQASVVGLGFGIHFDAVVRAGSTGVVLTVATIAGTLALGWLLGRWFAVERVTGQLISTGTAICGGSAIAAMGPVLGAEARTMSVALGCVFLLNAVALFVFPPLGHAVGLTPEQFGWWAAIAIHDTSSVVGAAAKFSPDALAIAVPVKLARALWILPLVAGAAWWQRRAGAKAAMPWFVLLFMAASLVATFIPAGAAIYPWLARGAKAGLAVTLFLIGASLSKSYLVGVGWRPFALGATLWLMVTVVSLAIVRAI